jgi:hypothetical protein
MTIQILSNFIDPLAIARINKVMAPCVKETPREHILSALGWSQASEALKIGFGSSSPIDTEKLDLTATFKKCLSEMRDFYKIDDLVLVNAFYVIMNPGARMGLHCDNCNLDGSPLAEDLEIEPNEWSAILYLNNYAEDFLGGEIGFPKQNLVYKPIAGDFLHFKTDVEHPHEVLEVESGSRACLVIFTGREEVARKVDADFSSR